MTAGNLSHDLRASNRPAEGLAKAAERTFAPAAFTLNRRMS